MMMAFCAAWVEVVLVWESTGMAIRIASAGTAMVLMIASPWEVSCSHPTYHRYETSENQKVSARVGRHAAGVCRCSHTCGWHRWLQRRCRRYATGEARKPDALLLETTAK